jgi:hypothetical protein
LPFRLFGTQSCGRVDRHVGCADEEIGLAGDFAARWQFAAIADFDRGFDQRTGVEIEHRLSRPADRRRSDHRQRSTSRFRIPSAAAPSRSLWSASRLRSRQVSCSTGSIAVLVQDYRCRHRAEMRARARAIGDVDGVGKALQRHRLREQLVGSAGDRRSDLGGDDEPAGRNRLL